MQNSFRNVHLFFLFCWLCSNFKFYSFSCCDLFLMFRMTYSVVIIMIYNEKFHVLNCLIFNGTSQSVANFVA